MYNTDMAGLAQDAFFLSSSSRFDGGFTAVSCLKVRYVTVLPWGPLTVY